MIPYKEINFPLRVLREQHLTITQKGFNINYFPIATQGTYRRKQKEKICLIRASLIREMFRKTDQESKFQKFSLKLKFVEMKTLQKELADTAVTYTWVH